MPDNRETHCSICGQTIKTVRGAIRLKTAPLVCRRCFGEQTYTTTTAWKFPVAGAEAIAEN
jgi:hypothetical protein